MLPVNRILITHDIVNFLPDCSGLVNTIDALDRLPVHMVIHMPEPSGMDVDDDVHLLDLDKLTSGWRVTGRIGKGGEVEGFQSTPPHGG